MTTDELEAPAVPMGTLVVTVLAAGEPSPAQTILVQGTGAGDPSAGGTTGEDGLVSFALEADKQYLVSATTETGVPSKPRLITVQPGEAAECTFAFHRIFGHVVDTDGNPIRQRALTIRMGTPALVREDGLYEGAQVIDVQTPVEPRSGEFWLLAAPGTYQLECIEGDRPLGQQRVEVGNAAIHISLMLFERPVGT